MSISVYYREPIILDRPVGNNIFVYDERKEISGKAEIVVPQLIVGTLDDVQLGYTIVFAEEVAWDIKEFAGLKSLVCLRVQDVPVYVMDNHNHALYCWYKEYLTWNIGKGLPLIHIDQHSDMNDPAWRIDEKKEHDLSYIAQYVNEVCTIADFIQPALRSGLLGECVQVRTEYWIINGEWWMVNDAYILDIDIDFWAPEMGIEEFDRTIQKARQLIAWASLVTIATSPCFIEQYKALEIVKLLLS